MPVIKTSNLLAQHWLSTARDKDTNSDRFKKALENIGLILFSEAINDVSSLSFKKTIKTPLKKITGSFLNQNDIFIIPILRAGLGMLVEIRNLVPEAKIAHVGLYRNEYTFQPHWYLDKLPKKINKSSTFFVLEPMLATGGTITTVLERIIALGAEHICVLSVLTVKSTKKMLEKKFPRVRFYVAGIDPYLNSKAYIVPGLGDAGDRTFNL